MKYCFELYKVCDKIRKFIGYKQLNADSAEQALATLKEKTNDESIVFTQIWVPQND